MKSNSSIVSATLHGTGRFGQHLLYAWLKQPSAIQIKYICDAFYDIESFTKQLKNHDKLDFNFSNPDYKHDQLFLTDSSGFRHQILFFSGSVQESHFIGRTVLWLECSGAYTDAQAVRLFCRGQTQKVLISATSYNADQTLIMGFNHHLYNKNSQIISYGSCTVNAFVPFANQLNKRFSFSEAFVEVTHSTTVHAARQQRHPARRHCTLTDIAPKLLDWINPDNFHVGYHLIPYQGASLIQFIFFLDQTCSKEEVLQYLTESNAELYLYPDEDLGIQQANNSPYNAVFPKSQIKVKGNKLILQGYFDNENSAARYYDLVNYISQHGLQ